MIGRGLRNAIDAPRSSRTGVGHAGGAIFERSALGWPLFVVASAYEGLIWFWYKKTDVAPSCRARSHGPGGVIGASHPLDHATGAMRARAACSGMSVWCCVSYVTSLDFRCFVPKPNGNLPGRIAANTAGFGGAGWHATAVGVLFTNAPVRARKLPAQLTRKRKPAQRARGVSSATARPLSVVVSSGSSSSRTTAR